MEDILSKLMSLKTSVERNHYASSVLPLGHIERTKAKEAVKEEYAACNKQEKEYTKRVWGKKPPPQFTTEQVMPVCIALCKAIGSKPPKGVLLTDKPWNYYRFSSKTIHLFKVVRITSIIHELAHHVANVERMNKGGMHGEGFLEVERILFDIFLQNPNVLC